MIACISLSLISVGVGILGGAFIAAFKLQYPVQQYFNTMFVFVEMADMKCLVLKAAVFWDYYSDYCVALRVSVSLRGRRGGEGRDGQRRSDHPPYNCVRFLFNLLVIRDIIMV